MSQLPPVRRQEVSKPELRDRLLAHVRSWHGARLWWGLPVLLGLLWLAGLTSVVTYPGLPSPPDVTVWLMPATRYARDIAAALTVGSVVVGGLLLSQGSPRVLGWARRWAAAWLGLVLLGLVLTRSEVEALSPVDALAPGSLMPLLVGEIVGRVFLGQAVAILAVIGITYAMEGRRASFGSRSVALSGPINGRLLGWLCALLAVGAAAAPAFAGHAGLHDSHSAATVSLLIHIAAVSIWVGGLAVVVALGRCEPRSALRVLPAFSVLALWCVILIAETGLLNASLRLSLPTEFIGTLYGSLIIGKATLLGWLVALGYRQRRRVIDPFAGSGADESGPVMKMLARYAAWEFGIMALAIALSVALARIGPAPAEIATGTYSPVALAVLAIGLPLLLVWLPGVRAAARAPAAGFARSKPRPRRRAGMIRRILPWLSSHSELPAVILLVVVADVAGLQAFNAVLGDQLGTIVGVLTIVGAGWLWATCTASKQGWSGILVVMVGWPIVMWVNSLGQAASLDPGVRMTIASVIAVEIALCARLLRGRALSTRHDDSVSDDSGSDDSVNEASPQPSDAARGPRAVIR